jgi:mannose-P-dolichol utilization defect 1
MEKIISQALGGAIMLGAAGLKVPQIQSIWKGKQVEGLNAMSVYAEVPLIGTAIVYNILKKNPYTSYGELFFLLVQNFIIVLLFFKYKPVSLPTSLSVLAFYALITGISFNLPEDLQPILPNLSLPLTIFSRVPQVQ